MFIKGEKMDFSFIVIILQLIFLGGQFLLPHLRSIRRNKDRHQNINFLDHLVNEKVSDKSEVNRVEQPQPESMAAHVNKHGPSVSVTFLRWF